MPAFDAPLDEQLARVSECQRNASYLAQVGRLLNGEGRYTEAIDHLERALMFEPDLPGAQLDYAIALAGTGDMLSARQLIDNIIAQPELTQDMRDALVRAKQRLPSQTRLALTAPTNGPLTFQVGTNIRTGHDSNLLGTPNLTSLELTFPGEVVVLPLTDSNAPRPGGYTRAEAKFEFSYLNPDGSRWGLAANVMHRNSAAVPESDTRQSELVLEYAPPLANGTSGYWSASRVLLNNESGTQYTSQGFVAGLQSAAMVTTARSICSGRAGVDWQDRQLLSNPILSGRYTGLAALWSCNTPTGGQWQVSAKAGHDRPANLERPGGEQTVANMRVFATTGSLLLDLELSHARDTTGYSPLLDNNAVRHTSRINTRLEYQHQFGQRTVGTLGAEWSNQQSNLPLFKLQSWGPYAALRYVW